MVTEAALKIKAVFFIAILAVAEAQQVQQKARFHTGGSSSQVHNWEVEGMMNNQNFHEQARLAGERIQAMMGSANLQEDKFFTEQMEALTHNPSFQAQAKRFAEQMEAMTASPKLQEHVKLFAEQMEGMKANPSLHEHAKRVAEQMESMLTNKDSQEQGKIFAEQTAAFMTSSDYQEEVNRVAKLVESILADPTLQEQVDLLVRETKGDPTFQREEKRIAEHMGAWAHAEGTAAEYMARENFADELTSNVVDELFDAALKVGPFANTVSRLSTQSVLQLPNTRHVLPISHSTGVTSKFVAQHRLPLHVASAAAAAPVAASAMTTFLTVIAPKLGTVIANAMFLTGVPPVLEARKNNTLGELNPIPFAVIVANCAAWVSYGFLTANPYVLISNAPGVLLGLFYTMTGVRLADDKTRKTLETLLVTFVGILIASGMVSSLILTDMASRASLAGYVANAFVFLYYGSPLTTLGKVLQEKSSASLYAPLISVNVLNGAFWTGYGLAVKDLYIAVPNGVGVILGAIQLLLCAIFPSKKK